MNKKIGLLAPRSVLYPTMGLDIFAGLKLCLAEAGFSDVEIETESIGAGANDKVTQAACEKLLMKGIDIIAGYVNPGTAELLAPLFEGAGAIFIALDSGYHYRSSMKKMPNVFYLSLESALCCKVAMRTAMADGKKSFAFSTSFYDSGYKSGYSFVRTLEEGGGRITYNHITKLNRSEFDISDLSEHLAQPGPDAVIAAFCGDMMQDLFTAAARTNIFRQHAVYAAPFMADEQWLSQSTYPGVDVKTCVTWARSLNNVAHVFFMETMQKKKKNPNLFSLLGWEAALMVAQILKAEDAGEAEALLEGFTYSSPRGEVVVNVDTHHTNAPVYNAVIKKDAYTGNCILQPSHESVFTHEERVSLENDINNFSGFSTNWYNAYACLES